MSARSRVCVCVVYYTSSVKGGACCCWRPVKGVDERTAPVVCTIDMPGLVQQHWSGWLPLYSEACVGFRGMNISTRAERGGFWCQGGAQNQKGVGCVLLQVLECRMARSMLWQASMCEVQTTLVGLLPLLPRWCQRLHGAPDPGSTSACCRAMQPGMVHRCLCARCHVHEPGCRGGHGGCTSRVGVSVQAQAHAALAGVTLLAWA